MLKTNPKRKNLIIILFIAVNIILFINSNLFAGKIRLKEKEDGNVAEVLEEGADFFIIKVPKDEIESVKEEEKEYEQIKLWREKKILWEDQGDYITIFLPKERIVAPEGEGEKAEGAYYGKGKIDALQEALSSTGAKATFETGLIPYQGKGNVIGKIFDGKSPFEGCKVKIVYLKGQSDILTKLLGVGVVSGEGEEGEIVFETETNKDGLYEFNGVPVGNYDLHWLPPRGNAWIRKLSEKPSITVIPGKTVQYEDINLR